MRLTNEECNQAFKMLDHETKQWLLNFAIELKRAKEKHPSWTSDHIHAAAIVGEESGELLKAALKVQYEQGKWDDMQPEAIQIGAMALRFLLEFPPIDSTKNIEYESRLHRTSNWR